MFSCLFVFRALSVGVFRDLEVLKMAAPPLFCAFRESGKGAVMMFNAMFNAMSNDVMVRVKQAKKYYEE